ncbi:MAG: hypothetical protein M3290_00315 [Actinomycetota bacterium]|nr:hypothetical protein [Actinomycetota bacterium]
MIDKTTVEQHARTHGEAVVAGDLRTAGSSLTKDARDQAGAVMGALPKTLEAATVESVDEADEGLVARIKYTGEGREVVVESLWEDRDGEPKIAALRVV